MSVPNKSGVYKITNKQTGDFYIGSAVNLRTRKNYHFHNLKHNKHTNSFMQEDYNKFGESSFQFEVLLFCEPDQCLVLEQQHIDELKPSYNIAPTAGSQAGMEHSEETKQLISEKSRKPKGQGIKALRRLKNVEELLEELKGEIRPEEEESEEDFKNPVVIEKRLKPKDPRSLRNLIQYRDMTDEEWETQQEKIKLDLVPKADFEKLIKQKMDEFEKYYDLTDMKINDLENLRALSQGIIMLEIFEQMSWSLIGQVRAAPETIPDNLVIIDKLEDWKNNLRKSISLLQEDLKITRKTRKSDSESVIEELEKMRKQANEFYKEKMAWIFCHNTKCNELLTTAWFLYPDLKNQIRLHCKKCGEDTLVNTKEIYENKQASNRPELIPEGMV